MTDAEAMRQISKNTILARAMQWAENFLANLPYVEQGLGLRIFNDVFKGLPTILVGAGPSLDKNIQHLHRLRNKACIVACDAALEAVLDAGCKPHFVAVSDSKPRCLKYIDLPNHDLSGICMLADTRIHPEVRDGWKGGPIIWHNPIPIEDDPLSFHFHLKTGQIGAVGTGGSVMSSMWVISLVFFASMPIVLMGLDCSFSNVAHHHASVVKNTERYDAGQLSVFESYTGEQVFSNPSLLSFKEWFETMLVGTPSLTINCTEGGILTQGCAVMRLSDPESENGDCERLFLKNDHDFDALIEERIARGAEIMNQIRWENLPQPGEDEVHVAKAPPPVQAGRSEVGKNTGIHSLEMHKLNTSEVVKQSLASKGEPNEIRRPVDDELVKQAIAMIKQIDLPKNAVDAEMTAKVGTATVSTAKITVNTANCGSDANPVCAGRVNRKHVPLTIATTNNIATMTLGCAPIYFSQVGVAEPCDCDDCQCDGETTTVPESERGYTFRCNAIKANGEPCLSVVENYGDRCPIHQRGVSIA